MKNLYFLCVATTIVAVKGFSDISDSKAIDSLPFQYYHTAVLFFNIKT